MQTFRPADGEKGTRPLKWGDICILLRSKSAHAAAYVDELNRCGVPAWTAAAGGFLDAPEIASAVSLLRSVDNPAQDIPCLLYTSHSGTLAYSVLPLSTLRFP